MENLQKIVVLCAVLFIGIFVGAQFVDAPIETEDGMTQIDPPSMDMDSGPDDSDLDESKEPEQPNQPDKAEAPKPDEPVACTMDAKQCPDGSYVGRVAPDCEFAECPAPELDQPDSSTVVCSPESKKVDACIEIYQPVCGLVQVQCFTTPCDPVPETFSNGCHACRQGNVVSYTEGACEADA